MTGTTLRPQLIDRVPFVPFVLYAIERFLHRGHDYTATTTLHADRQPATIQKTVRYHTPHNQLVHALCIEAEVYRLLAEAANAATVTTVHTEPGLITLTRPLQPGITLADAIVHDPHHWTPARILAVLDGCIQDIRALPFAKKDVRGTHTSWIPRVSAGSTYVLLPLYALVALLRTPQRAMTIGRLVLLALKQWWLPDFFGTSVILNHRDAGPANIILSEKRASEARPSAQFIDWESGTYAEAETELATIGRLYFTVVPPTELTRWIGTHLASPAARRRFLRLSCFYLLQFLSSELKTSTAYQTAWSYADHLLETAHTFSTPSRTAYEQLWYGALHWIGIAQRLPFVRELVWFKTVANRSIIFCYHSISHYPWRFALPPEQFERQLQWLKTHMHVLPLEELLTQTKKRATEKTLNKPMGRSVCALTFDDGYTDLLETATSYLRALALPATAFIITDPKHADRVQLDSSLPLLSLADARALPKKTWTIGSHTATHARLSQLTPDQLKGEFELSRQTIKTLTNTECQFLAYPQGFYNQQIESAAQRAGYSHAFTTDGGSVAVGSLNPMAIDRIIIEQDMDEFELAALLTPFGLALSRRLIQLLKYKSSHLDQGMR